ncbi:MAG: cupin domain-containing protein [Proteobacteria bacterium]|nr:cupin domain-containing protein [Pseudomonadota bacterium]
MDGDGTGQAVPTVQVNNERVRVTEWRFAPGAATGLHRHEYDYVVVPVLDGDLVITGAEGESRSSLKTGVSYFRRAGVEHDVRNGNPYEFAFIEIEMK